MIQIWIQRRDRYRYSVVLSICKFEGALATSIADANQNKNIYLCPHFIIPIPQSLMVPAIPGSPLILYGQLPH